MIWSEATNIQRQVAMFKHQFLSLQRSDTGPLLTPCVPVLLHTSLESRTIALKIYKLVQYEDRATNFPHHRNSPASQPAPLYFDFVKDLYIHLVISSRPTAEDKHDYLMTSYRLPYFPQSFITQVRHLAIFPGELVSMTMIQGPGKRTVEDLFYSLLKPFLALETLYLIGHFERQDKAQLPFLSVVTESMEGKTECGCLYCCAYRAKETIKDDHSRHLEWNCPEIKLVEVRWAMGVTCGIPK